MTIATALVQSFCRYVAVSSQSDGTQSCLPTTAGQLELAKLLQADLQQLGYHDSEITEHGILIAKLPGNKAGAKTLGFVAHLDTVDVGLSADIKPQLLRYEGAPLTLNHALNITIDEQARPELAQYKGQDILFSDGTSVLGADNKAAIAVMMTLAEQLKTNGESHGDIYFAFVPDEEVGLRGSKVMPLDKFPVTHCYTIDCCERGEVVYETFNAGQAVFTIQGVTAHPMSAKNVLVNPNLIANDLINLVSDWGLPETTEQREGYFWVIDIQGNQTQAKVTVQIRDHNQHSYQARKAYLQQVLTMLQHKHPRATIDLDLTDTYGNIAEAMGDDTSALDNLYQALAELNIPAKTIAMRGGTDGSALSVQGLFTPNFFTGAHNFHSAFEFLPVPSFVDSYQVAKRLVAMA
ncbi:peptidase T [Ferrimonas senticii]|uniref:peptidase T n=1 Tax=Ferrimonas senticii TaxID=394566 RepID=UPI0003FA2DF6|nr:peptidase T [Ferrimonas senticii]